MNLNQTLEKVDKMDIGEAKKVRLRSVVRRYFAISKNDEIKMNITRLSKFSRVDLSKIGSALKKVKSATNENDLIKREFGIEVQ